MNQVCFLSQEDNFRTSRDTQIGQIHRMTLLHLAVHQQIRTHHFFFCLDSVWKISYPQWLFFKKINVFPQKQSVTFPYPHIMKSMYQEMSLFGNK